MADRQRRARRTRRPFPVQVSQRSPGLTRRRKVTGSKNTAQMGILWPEQARAFQSMIPPFQPCKCPSGPGLPARRIRERSKPMRAGIEFPPPVQRSNSLLRPQHHRFANAPNRRLCARLGQQRENGNDPDIGWKLRRPPGHSNHPKFEYFHYKLEFRQWNVLDLERFGTRGYQCHPERRSERRCQWHLLGRRRPVDSSNEWHASKCDHGLRIRAACGNGDQRW